MICQNIYRPGIRDAVQKGVTNFDTCQHTKPSNIKYGKFSVKQHEKIPWNKLSVVLIRFYLIQRNEKNGCKEKKDMCLSQIAMH